MSFPKPEKRKTVKRRKYRTEAQVKKLVRDACIERDTWCLLEARGQTASVGPCVGPSEWAHLPPWTRAHTRNMPLEVRHSTAGSAMLCRTHHDHVDGRRHPRVIITCLSDRGADGPITAQLATS